MDSFRNRCILLFTILEEIYYIWNLFTRCYSYFYFTLFILFYTFVFLCYFFINYKKDSKNLLHMQEQFLSSRGPQ